MDNCFYNGHLLRTFEDETIYSRSSMNNQFVYFIIFISVPLMGLFIFVFFREIKSSLIKAEKRINEEKAKSVTDLTIQIKKSELIKLKKDKKEADIKLAIALQIV